LDVLGREVCGGFDEADGRDGELRRPDSDVTAFERRHIDEEEVLTRKWEQPE
jgi:hypothetical protein